MEPEPIIACFIGANDLDRPLHLATNAGADLADDFKQPVPAFYRVLADFVRQRSVDCDNPALLAQFYCHEAGYCAIMGCGGWQVVHCSGHPSVSPMPLGCVGRE